MDSAAFTAGARQLQTLSALDRRSETRNFSHSKRKNLWISSLPTQSVHKSKGCDSSPTQMTDLQRMGPTENLSRLYTCQCVRTVLWNIVSSLVIVFMNFFKQLGQNKSCSLLVRNSSSFVTAATLPGWYIFVYFANCQIPWGHLIFDR